MKRSTPILLALILAWAGTVPSVAAGQTRSLTWTQVNEVDAHSMMSMVVSLMGMGDPVVTRSATHVQGGSVMIQETGQSASIIDLDSGEMLMIDHAQRSVIRADLATLPDLAEEVIGSVREDFAGDPELQAQWNAMQAQGSGVSMDFDVTVHPNVRSENIGPYQTNVHYVVVQADMQAPPMSPEAGQMASLYFVTELWETQDVPTEGEIFAELGGNIAGDPRLRELASVTTPDPLAGFGMLDSFSPGLGAAMLTMANAMEQFNGTILREVSAVSLTPVGTVLALPDLEALIASDPEASTAMSVMGSALRGALGGVFGGGGGAASSPDPSPNYTPYLRILSTREDLAYTESDEDVLGALLDRIEGYRVQELSELISQLAL